MGGVELAAAVSNAGGLGSLALTWTPPDEARHMVNSLRAQTPHPFFINFVLAFPPSSLDAALEAGAPIVTFSWGQPGELVEKVKVHQFEALAGVQVGPPEGARLARDAGADFLHLPRSRGRRSCTIDTSVSVPVNASTSILWWLTGCGGCHARPSFRSNRGKLSPHTLQTSLGRCEA